jgi:multidrug efflux system membrane fusion protein
MEQKPPVPPIPPDHQLPAPSPPAAPPRKKKSLQWLWITLLLLFALIFFLLLRHHDEKGAAAAAGGRRGFMGPVTLTEATAKKGDIGVYLEAIGTVTPVYTTTLYSQVTGVITAVHYREGQMVHKGDPLVDIDPRQFQANVATAQGNLEHDTGVLAQAQMDLTRYQAAWARNAIAKQQLDDQEKLVEQEQGTVKSDEGTLAYDKVQLSYCHIVSPINGRVGLRLIDPGNLITAGSTTVLAVVTQVQPITVIFTIAQDNLDQVLAQPRKGVGLEVDAYDRSQQNKIATGKVLAIDNQIDTTTGTVKIRAQFDNRNGMLFPNQFVNTRLLVTTEHDMTLIPDGAIQHNGEISFVYAIKNGTARVSNVKAGTSDGGITAVQGIRPGDVIATSSFEKLQAGSKVILAKSPAAATSAPESNAP